MIIVVSAAEHLLQPNFATEFCNRVATVWDTVIVDICGLGLHNRTRTRTQEQRDRRRGSDRRILELEA